MCSASNLQSHGAGVVSEACRSGGKILERAEGLGVGAGESGVQDVQRESQGLRGSL